MKIEEITESVVYYVTTSSNEYPVLRRNGHDNWEYLIGESWEALYDCEEIEAEFAKRIKSKQSKIDAAVEFARAYLPTHRGQLDDAGPATPESVKNRLLAAIDRVLLAFRDER